VGQRVESDQELRFPLWVFNPHFKAIGSAKAKPRRERTRARYSLRQKVVLGFVRNNDFGTPPSKRPSTELSEVVDEPFGQ
jgi:hypothetical protein